MKRKLLKIYENVQKNLKKDKISNNIHIKIIL